MKVVILAGGLGTRLSEETEDQAQADGGESASIRFSGTS